MNLYDLDQSFKNLIEVLETQDLEEELKETIYAELEKIEISKGLKVDNIIKYINNIDGDIFKLKAEERKLQQKRKTLEKKVENLQAYLFDYLKGVDGQEVKGDIFTASIKRNPPKVNITCLEAIPREYIKIIEEVDKVTLKKALKLGYVAGAELIQEESLKIK